MQEHLLMESQYEERAKYLLVASSSWSMAPLFGPLHLLNRILEIEKLQKGMKEYCIVTI